MSKYVIYVRSMSATYRVGVFYADSLDGAIQQARSRVMPDQRGWKFYEVEDDEE